jgi:hypothetical protein
MGNERNDGIHSSQHLNYMSEDLRCSSALRVEAQKTPSAAGEEARQYHSQTENLGELGERSAGSNTVGVGRDSLDTRTGADNLNAAAQETVNDRRIAWVVSMEQRVWKRVNTPSAVLGPVPREKGMMHGYVGSSTRGVVTADSVRQTAQAKKTYRLVLANSTSTDSWFDRRH